MVLGRTSTFAAMLALLGCAPRTVPASALAYPVLVLESYGPEVFPTEALFCSTPEHGQDRYRSMVLMDVTGRRYSVARAMPRARDKPWFMDLAGNAPVHMEVILKPEEAMDLAQAKAWIAAHIQAKGDYLDLLDGGRAQVLGELQSDATLEAFFLRFADHYAFRTVLAKYQQKEDACAGIPPIQPSRRKPQP